MKPYFNLALNILYGTALEGETPSHIPDRCDRQEVERCHSLEDGIQEAYEEGKAQFHSLPSSADLDAVAEEVLIRDLSHPDPLQRELANTARTILQKMKFAARMAARKDLTT